ncbi:hypothetical protein BD410DRAFT_807586 [Rickenella mellea]|uniref:Uncharacterized protein n=1 Tax=Rickenella mellea TaxID=50990 RepID=A0A4Y7PR61_9AGAM|nr:hypothetical protein BD410DRAFT_807586 [Rickenella mellea]
MSHQWKKLGSISNGCYSEVLECSKIMYTWIDRSILKKIVTWIRGKQVRIQIQMHSCAALTYVISAMAMDLEKDLENNAKTPILPSLQRMIILSNVYEVPDETKCGGILQLSAFLIDEQTKKMFKAIKPIPSIDKLGYILLKKVRWRMMPPTVDLTRKYFNRRQK